jgi:general secretion pathway protein I
MITLKRLRSQRGVTLLEVMIAVAIASIALVSLISLVLSSLEMEDHARRLTDAMMIADEQMKEIERGDLPEVGETEGLIKEDEPYGYAYKRTVSETPIENVHHVIYTVLWNKKRDSVSLEAYMIKKQ